MSLITRFNEDPYQFSLEESLQLLKQLDHFEYIKAGDDFKFLTILKYDLIELQEPEHYEAIENNTVLSFCCKNNYMITFKWIVQQYPRDLNREIYLCITEAFKRNDINLVKMLYEKMQKEDLLFTAYNYASFEMLMFILEKFPEIDEKENIKDKIYYALHNKNIEVIEFLINKCQEAHDFIERYIFHPLIPKEVIEYYFSTYISQIDYSCVISFFKIRCFNDDLTLAQFIYNLSCNFGYSSIFNSLFSSTEFLTTVSVNDEIIDWIRSLTDPEKFKNNIQKVIMGIMGKQFYGDKIYKLALELNIDFDVNEHLENACKKKYCANIKFLLNVPTLDRERTLRLFDGNFWGYRLEYFLRDADSLDEIQIDNLFKHAYCQLDLPALKKLYEICQNKGYEFKLNYESVYRSENLECMKWMASFYDENDIRGQKLLIKSALDSSGNTEHIEKIEANGIEIIEKIEKIDSTNQALMSDSFNFMRLCIQGELFKLLKLIWEKTGNLSKEQLTKLFEESLYKSLRIHKYMFKISQCEISEKSYLKIVNFCSVSHSRWLNSITCNHYDLSKKFIGSCENNCRKYESLCELDCIDSTIANIAIRQCSGLHSIKFLIHNFNVDESNLRECYNYNRKKRRTQDCEMLDKTLEFLLNII